LRAEQRLRVFENMVLRRIFGPKDKVTGEWRTLHSEELYIYSSPDIIRVVTLITLRKM